MNVTLISVIVALALFLLKIEHPSKRNKDFLILYYKSLSKLDKAKTRNTVGKPVNEETARIIKHFDEGADKINKCFRLMNA